MQNTAKANDPRSAVTRIDWTSVEYRSNHVQALSRLRELGPVFRSRIPMFGKIWVATSYESVNEVLKNTDDFVRDPQNAGRRTVAAVQWLMHGLFRRLSKNMLSRDEPDHRRLRSLVDQAFARQNIDSLRERIVAFTADCLENTAEQASIGGGTVDLVQTLARPLPLVVICELLGLPLEDRPKFRKWFSAFSTVTSVFGIFKVIPGIRKTMRYLRDQFHTVADHPRDGLITALVEAERGGDRLSEDELLSMAFLLLVAGHETTVHLISTGILSLLQFPERKRELMSDWSKLDTAVEEMLRFNSPILFGKPRFVARDMLFHGQPLKRGEGIIPLLAAANFDPQQFDNPEEFDIERSPNYHLSFGSGPHVCLGLKLARAEAQIAIQSLFTRWPDLEPAFDGPEWTSRLGMRALKSLNVRLGTGSDTR